MRRCCTCVSGAWRQACCRTSCCPGWRKTHGGGGVVPLAYAVHTRHYDQARGRLLAHDFTDLHLATEAPVILLAPVELLYPNPHHMPEALRKARAIGGCGANAALILNPRLADIGFQRLVDPYTCFQAISQFIEGVVPAQQMPMVAISDASQVRKKGFDPKYGFRTRPAGHS